MKTKVLLYFPRASEKPFGVCYNLNGTKIVGYIRRDGILSVIEDDHLNVPSATVNRLLLSPRSIDDNTLWNMTSWAEVKRYALSKNYTI